MLTQEELKKHLSYNPETGLFTWLNIRKMKGKIAGSNCHQYIRINIRGKKYLAHRLAWLYMTGNWPKNQIDHKDRNKSNNSFINLREATRSQQQANSKTTGKWGRGISKNKNKWRACIYLNNKRIHLGNFYTIEEAKEIYNNKAKELFGEFILTN